MWALITGHNSVVDQQPSVDANRSDSIGLTAAHRVSHTDNLPGIRLLLGDPRLASGNVRNSRGRTPLDGGCDGGQAGVCEGAGEGGGGGPGD